MHVELAGARTRGQTVVDRRAWVGDLTHDPHAVPPAVLDVALAVDGERWRALWLAAVDGSGPGESSR